MYYTLYVVVINTCTRSKKWQVLLIQAYVSFSVKYKCF